MTRHNHIPYFLCIYFLTSTSCTSKNSRELKSYTDLLGMVMLKIS